MKKSLLLFLFIISLSAKGQWKEILNDSTYFWLSDVKFLNKDTGFVCGSSNLYPYPGIILKTTDGGATWDSSQLFYGWLMSLSVINDTIIYAGGQDGRIFKTINGGQTWVNNGCAIWCTEDVSSIYFLNQDTGIALYFTSGLSKTIDGNTWNYYPLYGYSYFPNNSSIQFLNDSVGFIAKEKVYKTSDGGNSWQKLNVDSTMKVSCIYMKDINDGIVIDLNGKVSLTFDGGNIWTPFQYLGPYALYDATFINDSIGYIIGGDSYYCPTNYNCVGKIFISKDRGYTWSVMQTFDHPLTSLYFVNDSVGYAVGQNGRILKITNANTVGINEIENKISTTLFPNPFHTTATLTTNFQFPISNYKLQIFDVMGRMVKEQIINNQSAIINRENLEDGIYFYQLTNDGRQMASGKFVVD